MSKHFSRKEISKIIENRVKTEGSDTLNSQGNINPIQGAKKIKSINSTEFLSDLAISSDNKLFRDLEKNDQKSQMFYEIQSKIAAQTKLHDDSDGAEDLEQPSPRKV